MRYPDAVIESALHPHTMTNALSKQVTDNILRALREEGWHFLSGISRRTETDGWGDQMIDTLLFNWDILESRYRIAPEMKATTPDLNRVLHVIRDRATHELMRVLAKRLLQDFENQFGKCLTAFTERVAVTKAEDE